MRLAYRGINYPIFVPTVEAIDTELTTKYRGLIYKIKGANISQAHALPGMPYCGLAD
ncbi:MAG: DUF4278 domain-containing protein [Cyanothece sp. SIO1E1]|nr:DUF4278 domain-containing protein [Cyanothece sp. SIO1E1]